MQHTWKQILQCNWQHVSATCLHNTHLYYNYSKALEVQTLKHIAVVVAQMRVVQACGTKDPVAHVLQNRH